jgi:hypothetical protein
LEYRWEKVEAMINNLMRYIQISNEFYIVNQIETKLLSVI